MNSDHVAAELRELASDVDTEVGELLDFAADALERTAAPSGNLASVDWPEVIENAGTGKGPWSGAADWLALVRDILFIAPVGWVWFKLWRAFDKFDSSETAPSFLAQWQGGFGGSGSTFAEDAFLVIVIVFFIAVLSLASFLFAKWGDHGEGKTREQLRGLGMRTQVLLAAKDTSPDPLAGIKDLADQMTSPVASLVDAVSTLCGQLQPTTDALAAHQAEVASIASDVVEITASANGIGTTLNGFVASSTTHIDQLAKAATDFQAESTKHFAELNEAANDFRVDSTKHFNELTNAATNAGAAGDQLAASVATSASSADQLRQQAERLNAATMSLAQSADLAARMFTNLRIEIEKLDGRAT